MESVDRQPVLKEKQKLTENIPMKKTPGKRYFSPESAVKNQKKYVFDEKKFIKAKQKQHMMEKELDKKDGKKNFKHANHENQDGRGDGKKDFKHEKVGKFRKKTGFNPRGRPISKDRHGKTKEPASSRDKSSMKKTPGKRYFSPQEAVKDFKHAKRENQDGRGDGKKNFKHAKRENQDSKGDGKKDFKHKKVGKFRKKTGFNPRGRPFSKDRHGKTKEPASSRDDRDPFPGEAPVSQEKMKKYMRGKQLKNLNTKSRFQSKMLQMKEKKFTFAAKQAARAELINQEEPGYLQADEHEETEDITQHDIADVVDITSAQKFFELKMNDFGPYRINYTRNGRFLLLGGRKGHVAAIDWMTKKLLCELNVMETLNDVRWLHQETMYAVAQKQWTYIYDNQGIELHCLKVLDRVLRMEFLPFHFLLATAHSSGYLSYIDVSVGEKVAGHHTWHGRLDVMCQNPTNAIVHLGHPGGKVTLWSPTVKEPLVKMLCHQTGVRSVAVDKGGLYMATSSIDRTLKIWDLRTYKTLQSYKLGACASQLAFSHTGLLAAGVGDIVQVYKDCCQRKVDKPYMSHNLTSTVNSLHFCPYEDVLGVGHGNGFTSLLIPGAGEANFDALEANPYQTKKQRREAEVKMLLDKVPVDMIHIDSSIISQVDEKTVQEKMDEKNKYLYGRLEKKDFVPRYKMKGKSKTGKKEQRKKGVIEEDRRQKIKDRLTLVRKEAKAAKQNKTRKSVESGSVLDRFIRKDT